MGVARGKHIKIRCFDRDGNLLELWNPQSATFNDVEMKERQERLGEEIARPRQTFDGHQGTLVFENDSPALMDIHDIIIEAARNAEASVYFDIIRTVRFPRTGEVRTYAYPDVVMSFDEDASGRNEALQTTVNWESSPRIIL